MIDQGAEQGASQGRPCPPTRTAFFSLRRDREGCDLPIGEGGCRMGRNCASRATVEFETVHPHLGGKLWTH
jgi:hypothetical protein